MKKMARVLIPEHMIPTLNAILSGHGQRIVAFPEQRDQADPLYTITSMRGHDSISPEHDPPVPGEILERFGADSQ